MTKEKGKSKEKNLPVETTEFIMTTADGKKMKVHAPVDSLDKDAESALEGVYRSC